MNQFLFLFKYGVKNLLRFKGRSFLMFMGLCLSTAFTLWVLNFSFSGSRELIQQFLQQFQGHYQVGHRDYFNSSDTKDFDFFKTIRDQDFIKPQSDSTPRITGQAFLSSETSSSGVMLVGMDPELEAQFTKLASSVTQGSFLDTKTPWQILIGKRLAKKLKVKIGDEIAVVAQGYDGSFANELFTIQGLFDLGGGEREEKMAFITLSSAQSFYALPSGHYHLRVFFSETAPKILGPKLQLSSWQKLVPEVALSVRLIDNFAQLISLILIIVICLGLANSLMIIFIERDKELRTLSILGTSQKKILSILAIEVYTLSFFALTSGLVLGHLASLYFVYYPLDIKIFTQGQAIIMGGIKLHPLIKFYPQYQYYLYVPLLILFFVSISFIVPLKTVLKRKNL